MQWIFTVSPQAQPDHHAALAREADALRRRVRQCVQTMTCPTHGRGPVVTLTGFAPGQFDLAVSGCCAEFVRRVKWRLEGL